MTRRKASLISLIILTLALFSVCLGPAFAGIKLPQPAGRVNDFASMLSQPVIEKLESELVSYEEKTGNEIAVVTVKNLQGTTVEDFAVRLFEEWKIGKKEKDNGVLFLIAKDERKVRIEVGYGLEPNLTDAQSHNIIRNIVSPAFKAGYYDQGVTAGVGAVIKTISGSDEGLAGENPIENPIKQNARTGHARGWNFTQLAYLGLFFVFGFFQWLISVLGRTKSWWLGGVLGGIVGLAIMMFSIVLGVMALAVLVPVGLLFDFVVSRAYEEGKRRHHGDRERHNIIPWWAGGNWGPGGFGGSRGGGFGGFGGGRSGGGGASGGW